MERVGMLFAVWNLSSTIQSILENADDGFRVVSRSVRSTERQS